MARSVFGDLNVRRQESRAANLCLLQTLADGMYACVPPVVPGVFVWLPSSGGYERVAFCHHVTLKRGVQLKPAPDLADLVELTPATKRGRRLEVLQRLTVTVEDPALLHTLVSPPSLPSPPSPTSLPPVLTCC